MSSAVHIDPNRLDAAMATRAWDVPELARQSGVNRATLYRVLRGEATPARRTIRRIAESLQVPVEDITEVVCS